MGFFGCGSSNYAPLDVVDKVDVQRYIGKWYEIALLPNSFEKGCSCTTAEYSLIDSKTLRVTNSCRKGSSAGVIDRANGKAFVVEGSNNAKLRVQFFWPFRAPYWIIGLADDYSWAIVSGPSRKYLWILCRTRQMDSQLYDQLLEKLRKDGFDLEKLKKGVQECK